MRWCLLLLILASGVAAAHVQEGLSPGITKRLARADWIAEGAKEPRRVVYVFTDPECPYCHELWKNLQSANAPGAQIRYLMVAVIKPSSRGKAAAILEAPDRAAALAENERRANKGGIAVKANLSPATSETLSVHAALMNSLGIYATPALVYDGVDGRVSVWNGLPSPTQLQAILTPP